MTWEIGLVLLIIAVMFICLILEFARPVIIIGATVSVMMLLGILTPAEAVQGFSNIGMLTIALLFIIGGTVQKSDLFSRFVQMILGNNRNLPAVLTRLMVPVTALSAFMNNTPIVTMLMGEVRGWCRIHGIKPSKLLLPLSYAAIFGGMITLIGTSTNLIVHGLMIDIGMDGFSLFALAVIGLPAAAAGCIYMISLGKRILPNRDTSDTQLDSKEYLVEMIVEADSPVIGKTIKQAKLRNLKGLYLFEIMRDGKRITPVSSNETLQAGDRLIFTGQASAVVDLYQIPGLKHTVGKTLQLDDLRNGNAEIVEAVVPNHSSLLHKSIKRNQFRGKFDAVVLAVHRKNERIKGKVGDIVLRPGDTLLLLAGQDFRERSQYTRDFYTLAARDTTTGLSNRKSIFAVSAMALMIVLASLNILSIFEAAILTVFALFVTKCVTLEDARRFVHLDILIVIACSLGVGYAVQKTGAASWIADTIINLTGIQHAIVMLIVVYLLTNLMTELITNTAAAVIMFPIAVEAAAKLQVDPLAFILAITIAASAAFASPIGYQTHLLVYGPGGYRFTDFMKVGIPLNLIYFVITIAIVSIFYL